VCVCVCVEDTVRYTLLVEVGLSLQELKDATYLESNIIISRQELCRVLRTVIRRCKTLKAGGWYFKTLILN